MPPTNMTSLTSPADIPASFIACLQGVIVRLINVATNCSNLDLVNLFTRCLGPDASAVIKGRFISVSINVDNSIFAFSADSRNL